MTTKIIIGTNAPGYIDWISDKHYRNPSRWLSNRFQMDSLRRRLRLRNRTLARYLSIRENDFLSFVVGQQKLSLTFQLRKFRPWISIVSSNFDADFNMVNLVSFWFEHFSWEKDLSRFCFGWFRSGIVLLDLEEHRLASIYEAIINDAIANGHMNKDVKDEVLRLLNSDHKSGKVWAKKNHRKSITFLDIRKLVRFVVDRQQPIFIQQQRRVVQV